jgi:hypothetical protein
MKNILFFLFPHPLGIAFDAKYQLIYDTPTSEKLLTICALIHNSLGLLDETGLKQSTSYTFMGFIS